MRRRALEGALRKNSHFPIAIIALKYGASEVGTNPRIDRGYLFIDQMPGNQGISITLIKSVAFLSITDACSLLERLLRSGDDLASIVLGRFEKTIDSFFEDKLRYEKYYGYNKREKSRK